MPMLRQITDQYSVAPELVPSDMAAVATAGYTTVICNRPDSEVPPDRQAAPMRTAAEAAGLVFKVLPITQQSLTLENAARHREWIEASDGPVLAYCRTGTRCTVIWALGHAVDHPADQLVSLAARAGYDIANLQPALTSIHAS
ncbi:MAG: TIGR01244 family sulfur transferase [Marinibacterium sp.]